MSKPEKVIRDVMSKTVTAMELNTTASDCARAMARKGVSCTVITQRGTAVGIVTERDLVSKVLAESVDAKQVLVRDIMSTPLITVSPDVSLTGGAELMSQYRVRRLVVVESSGSLAGLVTAGDIARSLAEDEKYRDARLNAVARYAEGTEGGPYQ